MAKTYFQQFEKKFGKGWVCSCGGAFQAEWLEAVSTDREWASARYLCQLCGREQIFSVLVGDRTSADSLIEISSSRLTSEDVLDIKREVAQISTSQIKSLDRRRRTVKAPALKITRHQSV